MNVSTTSLSKLISTRKEELARLLERRGTNFPVVERQNDLRISFIELELEDLEKINDQPQLNPNQQIVLEWLKSTWIDRKKNCWFPFEVINSLYYQFDVAWGKVSYEEFKRIEKDKPYIKAYGELTALEQFEVLELFSKWAQEQEEE